MLKFEAVTNILFIEVDDSDGRTGHLQFETSTDRIRGILASETDGIATPQAVWSKCVFLRPKI